MIIFFLKRMYTNRDSYLKPIFLVNPGTDVYWSCILFLGDRSTANDDAEATRRRRPPLFQEPLVFRFLYFRSYYNIKV